VIDLNNQKETQTVSDRARKRPGHAPGRGGGSLFFLAVILLSVAVLSQAGCGAVRGRSDAADRSGFLGDYSELEPRQGYEVHDVYINPDAAWKNYDSVQIDSVSLWVNEETRSLEEEERQMLTDLLYKALNDQLTEKFKVVDRGGPDVIRVRAALTQAEGAKVALRTLSTIVPAMFLISTAVGLSADVTNTVGTATLEAELLDSVTGERLAAAVDQRAGTKSLLAGSRTFKTWGDVEAACKFWAEGLTGTLVRLGVQVRD
jgi:hypothetical protein